MPFGLANAPATFQRLMQTVLQDLTPSTCLVYLDDVIVFGRNSDTLLENVRNVLHRLEQAGLRLQPSKCTFMQRKVAFLGHVIGPEGVHTDPSKVAVVREWPTPQSAEEVRKFLGLASYYRRSVKNFSTIAAPLNRLTEKGRKFAWSPACEDAFVTLRASLTTTPTLAFPDFSEDSGQFTLDTDASDTGIGAVLSQIGQDAAEHVIAYGSRALTKSERNYCTTRKEMLALVTFIKHFRPYLLGREFVVRTDHQALKWLQTFRDAEGQVARWQEALQEYNFRCIHRPGVKHGNADALSRRPARHHGDCPSQDSSIAQISLADPQSAEWAELQKHDPELALIYDRIRTHGVKPSKAEIQSTSWETHCLWNQWNRLQLFDGVLFLVYEGHHGRRIVVPRSQVQSVLQTTHDQLGHPGQRKMDIAVGQRFWWRNERRDVVNFCARCGECLRFKPPHQAFRAPLQPITSGYPNQIVAMDFVGPLPQTPRGNRYILVMVDLFTKWCEAVPLPSSDAVTTAQAIFDNWIARHGAPEQLHSDRASDFESRVIAELCQILNVSKTRTTAYHPQGNGQAERTNRTIKALLQAFTDEYNTREWDRALQRCLLAYRATVHRSTGHSPHCMLTGREIRLPLDLTIPSSTPRRLRRRPTFSNSTLTYAGRMNSQDNISTVPIVIKRTITINGRMEAPYNPDRWCICMSLYHRRGYRRSYTNSGQARTTYSRFTQTAPVVSGPRLPRVPRPSRSTLID